MRIAMMGAGAIGGYLGARLAEAGEDVSFIARGAHLEALKQDGLRVQSPLGEISLPKVKATANPEDIGHVDVVIFAVKLYDLEEAATAIAPLIGPETRIVTIQNGIDTVERLARFLPSTQIVGGATYISAYVDRPGVIVHGHGLTRLIMGMHRDVVVGSLREAFERASGVDVKTVDDIDAVLWMKFVALAAFSGATSLMRAGIGPILADPEARKFIGQLLDEGMAIASAAGHPMPAGYKGETQSLFRTLPPETKSSMANDLNRGKPIEVEWVSGRMHSLGIDLNLPTPAHSAVYRALHLYSRGKNPSR